MAIHYQSQGSEEGFDLAAEWSQRSEHWDEEELRSKWDSFDAKKQSVTIATIRHFAKQAGWQPEQKLFSDFVFKPIGQLINLNEPPPPPVWAIQNLAREQHVGLLTGAPGVGKSFLLLDLACNLCTGAPFLNLPTRQSHVVFMNAEDNLEIIHERLFARFEYHRIIAEMAEIPCDLRIDDITARLNYICTSELSKVVRFTDQDGNLRNKMAELLVQRLNQVKARANGEPIFLIMDPLAAYNGGEENSNTDMSVFVNFMRHIVAKTGATLLLCHHDRKGLASERDVGDNSGRGASAIFGGVRWGMRIRNTWQAELADFGVVEDDVSIIQRKYGAIEFTKANYSERMSPVVFERGRGGILVPLSRVDMGQQIEDFRNRYGVAMDSFVAWLGNRDTPVTWRELRNNRRLRMMAFGCELTRETCEEIVQILEVEGLIVNNRGIRLSV
jgi:RecA-family ATPase